MGELGGGSVCIVDVRRLNDVRSVVPRCDVAEVGDSGDGVRVDPCVLGLLPEAVVNLHVLAEAVTNVRADAGHEGRHVRGGVGVARGDDGGRALVLLVVVEVEKVGRGKTLPPACHVVCLRVDGDEVVEGFCGTVQAFFSLLELAVREMVEHRWA